MSITMLRQDLNKTGGLPDISYEDLQPLGSPAAVYSDGSIAIELSLSAENKLEAEAHELMHILLNRRGLYKVESQIEGPEQFLALEMNNAISHHLLINELREEYGIQSSFHLEEREKGLRSARENIEEFSMSDDIKLLHGIGVRLYDIKRTIPESFKLVEVLINTNIYVKEAFNKAEEILSTIVVLTPSSEQEKKLNTFIRELGYNPNNFSYN